MTGQTQTVDGSTNYSPAELAGSKAAAQSQLKLASKALALTGILQTTLEINELMALFFKELGQITRFDGLYYNMPSSNIEINLGNRKGHNCSYQLIVANEQLGNIKFFRNHRFRDNELEIIENLLAGLLYPLRNTLLYHKALQSAILDPLTGTKNRATMDGAIKREIDLAQRHGTPLSIILFDLDHFKSINDNYGHLHGDKALREVAQCAQQTIRESDMLFRYGGEEFLVLLTGTDLDGAKLLGERIRSSVEALKPLQETDAEITISLGATSLGKGDDVDSFLNRVDDALYKAKQQGRNRVEIA